MKVNGHHFCLQLRSMSEGNFLLDHITNHVESGSSLISEKCSSNECKRTVTFEFEML